MKKVLWGLISSKAQKRALIITIEALFSNKLQENLPSPHQVPQKDDPEVTSPLSHKEVLYVQSCSKVYLLSQPPTTVMLGIKCFSTFHSLFNVVQWCGLNTGRERDRLSSISYTRHCWRRLFPELQKFWVRLYRTWYTNKFVSRSNFFNTNLFKRSVTRTVNKHQTWQQLAESRVKNKFVAHREMNKIKVMDAYRARHPCSPQRKIAWRSEPCMN